MALPGQNPTVQIAIVYDPATGLALGNIGRDLNQVASTVEQANTRLARSIETSVSTLARTGVTTGIAAFAAFSAAVTGGVIALEKLGQSFLTINENFANLEIAMKAALRTAEAARQIRTEIAQLTTVSFLPFEGLAGIARFMATTPSLRVQLVAQTQVAPNAPGGVDDPNGALRKMVGLIEQMRVFRPDRQVEDAIFSIRAMMAGNMTSLIRRFALPPQLLPGYVPEDSGVKQLKDLKTQPQVALQALQNLMNSLISPSSINEFLKQPKVLLQNFMEQLRDLPALLIGDTGVYQKILNYFADLYNKTSSFISGGFRKYVDQIGKGLSDMFDIATTYGNKFAENLLTLAGFSKLKFPDLSFADRLMKAITAAVEYAVEKLPTLLDRIMETFDKLVPVILKLGDMFLSLMNVFATSFNSSPWLTIIGGIAALKLLPQLIGNAFGAMQRGFSGMLSGGSGGGGTAFAPMQSSVSGNPSIFNSAALRGQPRDISQFLGPSSQPGRTYLTADAPEEFFAQAGKTRPAGNAQTRISEANAIKIFGTETEEAAMLSTATAAKGAASGLGAFAAGIASSLLAFGVFTAAIYGISKIIDKVQSSLAKQADDRSDVAKSLLEGRIAETTYTPLISTVARRQAKAQPVTVKLPETLEDAEAQFNSIEQFFKILEESSQRSNTPLNKAFFDGFKENLRDATVANADIEDAKQYILSKHKGDLVTQSGKTIKDALVGPNSAVKLIADSMGDLNRLNNDIPMWAEAMARILGVSVPVVHRASNAAEKATREFLESDKAVNVFGYKGTNPYLSKFLEGSLKDLNDAEKTDSSLQALGTIEEKFDKLVNPLAGSTETSNKILDLFKKADAQILSQAELRTKAIEDAKTYQGDINESLQQYQKAFSSLPDSTSIKDTPFDTKIFHDLKTKTIGDAKVHADQAMKDAQAVIQDINGATEKAMEQYAAGIYAPLENVFKLEATDLMDKLNTISETNQKSKITSDSPQAYSSASDLHKVLLGYLESTGSTITDTIKDTLSEENLRTHLFKPTGLTTDLAKNFDSSAQMFMSFIIQMFVDALTNGTGGNIAPEQRAKMAEAIKLFVQPFQLDKTQQATQDKLAADAKYQQYLHDKAIDFTANFSSSILGKGPAQSQLAIDRFNENRDKAGIASNVQLNTGLFKIDTRRMGEAAFDVQLAQIKELIKFNEQLTKSEEEQAQKDGISSEAKERLDKDIIKLKEHTAALKDELSKIAPPGDALQSFFSGLNESLSISTAKLMDFSEAGKELGTSIKTGLGTAFYEFIIGTKSAGDAFRDFGISVLETAAKIAAQKAANALIGLVFNIVSGAATGGSTSTIGTISTAFTNSGLGDGGPITGPSHNSGGVMINAEGGEFVIRKDQTTAHGIENLHALNEGRAMIVKKYGAGGRITENPAYKGDRLGNAADYGFYQSSLATKFSGGVLSPRQVQVDAALNNMNSFLPYDQSIPYEDAPGLTTVSSFNIFNPTANESGDIYGPSQARDTGSFYGPPSPSTFTGSTFVDANGNLLSPTTIAGSAGGNYTSIFGNYGDLAGRAGVLSFAGGSAGAVYGDISAGSVITGTPPIGFVNLNTGTGQLMMWNGVDFTNIGAVPASAGLIPDPTRPNIGFIDPGTGMSLTVSGYDQNTKTTFYQDSSGKTYASGGSSIREVRPGGAFGASAPLGSPMTPGAYRQATFGGVTPTGYRNTTGSNVFDTHAQNLSLMGYQAIGGNPNSPGQGDAAGNRFLSGVWQMDAEGGFSQVGDKNNASSFSHILINSPEGIAAYNTAAIGRHAQGNYIRGGSKIQDDVLILGMDGEFVVKKDAADYYGPQMLQDLNAKRLKRMASGGYATGTPDHHGGSGAPLVLNMPINISGSSGESPEDTQKRQEQAAKLQPLFREAIFDVIVEQRRPGGILH